MTDLGLIGKYRAEIYQKQAILIEIGYFCKKYPSLLAIFPLTLQRKLNTILHLCYIYKNIN